MPAQLGIRAVKRATLAIEVRVTQQSPQFSAVVAKSSFVQRLVWQAYRISMT
jgi:hypothetical protein